MEKIAELSIKMLFQEAFKIDPVESLPLVTCPIENLVPFVFLSLFRQYSTGKLRQNDENINSLTFEIDEKKAFGAHGWFSCETRNLNSLSVTYLLKFYPHSPEFCISNLDSELMCLEAGYELLDSLSHEIENDRLKISPIVNLHGPKFEGSLEKKHQFIRASFLAHIIEKDILPLSIWANEYKQNFIQKLL